MAAVLARIRVALVDSSLTISAGEFCLTSASVAVDAVHTDTAVHARAGGAVLVVRLAGRSRES